jgi:hypothetical protein
LLPIISFAFAMLNYKHDKTIALLRSFMAACERRTPDIYPALAGLGYNSNESYRKHANSTRRFHDWSCVFLMAVFNFVGLYVAQKAYPTTFMLEGWPIAAYFGSVMVSALLVMRSTFWPHKFEE